MNNPLARVLDRSRRELAGNEFAVIRYLGLHCGAGGQVGLPFRHREPAVNLWRSGFIEIWNRMMPGIGATGPFYGLTDRGRMLAGALLMRTKPRRAKSRDINHGDDDVSTR